MLEKSIEVEKLIEEYADCHDNTEEMNLVSEDNREKEKDLNPNHKEDMNEENNFDLNQNQELENSYQEEYEEEQIDDNNHNDVNGNSADVNCPNKTIQRKQKISNLKKKELRKKYEENIKKFFFKQSINNENQNENTQAVDNPENNNEEFFGFSRLKRLKKRTAIIKEKEINKKVSFNQFFEVEAELGSDNEEHDDVVKKLDQDEIEEEENSEEDLKDLIDDKEEEYSEEDIHEKYFSDMLQRDKEELKQVIEGPKRKILSKKRLRDVDDNLEENVNDLPLILRINNEKKLKQENSQENKFTSLFKNFESFEKRLLNSEEDHENEEFKEMLNLYQHNLIKKIAEKSKDHKLNLLNRIKENEKILENVINLNQYDHNSGKDKNNRLFIQGNSMNTLNKSNLSSNVKTDSTPIIGSSLNGMNCRMKLGSFMNSKNSFLHAMKNDKYYIKSNNEDVSLVSQNSAESNSSNSTASASSNSKSNSVPFFMKNSNPIGSNNKSTNLSCLFTRSSKPRHNVEPQIKKLRTPNKNEGNIFNLKRLLN